MSQISKLKEKCKELENEIEFHKSAHKQIVDENQIETYSERRIYMLKSQIFQLERQCMLMSKALSSRENVLQEIENEILKLINDYQELLASDITGPNIPVARSTLVKNIQALQKIKGSLFKHCTYENAESIQTNLITSSKFKKHDNLTCFDVCSGYHGHINLQQVSCLETDLSALFQTCIQLKENLSTMLTKHGTAHSLFPTSLYTNNFQLTNSCCTQLNRICGDLLRLSLLYPNNSKSQNLKTEKYFVLKAKDILKTVSPVSTKTKNVIVTMTKVHNYFLHMAQLENNALNIELKYLRESISLQYEYVVNLLNAVIEGYSASGKLMVKKVEKPIQDILTAWDAVKSNQSETNLRTFLNCFKSNELKLKSLIKVPESDSVVALNDFKQKLMNDVQKLQAKFDEDFARNHEKIKNCATENEANITMFKNLTLTEQ